MKNKLLAYIQANPRSTFSEIEGLFEREGFDYRGESSVELRPGANIMLWYGWNREAVNLILDLSHGGEIVFHPASWIERMCFGKAFSLPIAKQPGHDYKKLHWLPVVVSAAEVANGVVVDI